MQEITILDYVEAWRWWGISSLNNAIALRSPDRGYVWAFHEPADASSPQIYAFKTRHLAIVWGSILSERSVFGRVALWGEIIEDREGFLRAQYAYPLSLDYGLCDLCGKLNPIDRTVLIDSGERFQELNLSRELLRSWRLFPQAFPLNICRYVMLPPVYLATFLTWPLSLLQKPSTKDTSASQYELKVACSSHGIGGCSGWHQRTLENYQE